MKKFALYFDKDKEMEWLNKMVQEGYAMVDFFAGLYTFEPCEKGEWQYQIDIGNGFFGVKKEYSDFMSEMGIEVVKCWGPWVILRRKAQEGRFELFSDVDSRIEQYKKILILFKAVTCVELLALIYEIYAGLSGVTLAWPIAFIIAAFAFVLFNVIIRTKNILAELRERKGEAKDLGRTKNVSPAVSAGLLLNAVHLLAADHIPMPFRIVLLVISLGLIIYGAIDTANRKNRTDNN